MTDDADDKKPLLVPDTDTRRVHELHQTESYKEQVAAGGDPNDRVLFMVPQLRDPEWDGAAVAQRIEQIGGALGPIQHEFAVMNQGIPIYYHLILCYAVNVALLAGAPKNDLRTQTLDTMEAIFDDADALRELQAAAAVQPPSDPGRSN